MTVSEEKRIRGRALDLWNVLWAKRGEIWGTEKSLAELIPVPVEVFARSILGLDLDEPEDIPCERPGYQTAGIMDRPSGRIVAAQKFPYEWRRFTIAHEIAHWILHPEISLHRDRPLSGGEHANTSRPKGEQEADKFASELLMPSEILSGHFSEIFGGPVDGRTPNAEIERRLSNLYKEFRADDFWSNLRWRSLFIANNPTIRAGRFFPALAKRFKVSASAMAIQLEDLGLVR